MIEPLTSCPAGDPILCFEHIIGWGFGYVFGNPLYLGLFTLLVLVIAGFKLKLPADAFVLFISLAMLIVGSAYLGSWLGVVFMIGGGIIIGLAIIRLIKSR